MGDKVGSGIQRAWSGGRGRVPIGMGRAAGAGGVSRVGGRSSVWGVVGLEFVG